MDNQIFEILTHSPNEELIKIVKNKNNEFNQEAFSYAKQILEERGVDVTKIPTENITTFRIKTGDSSIKTDGIKSILLLISGILLLINGILFSPIMLIFGIINIYLAIRWRTKIKSRKAIAETITETPLTAKEIAMITELNEVIEIAKQGNLSKLEAFITNNISKENIDHIQSLYQTEFYENFLEEMKNIKSQYSAIKEIMQPLIQKEIVDPVYPHNRIDKSKQ